MTIPAFPLKWPDGWKRLAPDMRKRAAFNNRGRELTIAEAVQRVRSSLSLMGLRDDDIVISTNLKLRLDGYPRSDQGAPSDPGAAVYWADKNNAMRCMAIDRYDRVADNLAAVAATLEAMRAIERHGGAEILDRAFTGFAALAGPESKAWNVVLGVPAHASTDHVRVAYLKLRSLCHPDRNGDADTFEAVQRAWTTFCGERGVTA